VGGGMPVRERKTIFAENYGNAWCSAYSTQSKSNMEENLFGPTYA
jgi:hypothetical protein